MNFMGLAIVSLGSNIGDWSTIFRNTFDQLESIGKVDKKSSVYMTEPWGVKDQPWFKNQVIGLNTQLAPHSLMKVLLEIEALNGRNRSNETRWGKRTLDLDILFFEDEIIQSTELIIPHPRMHLRNFILSPVTEIYPQLIHPIFKKTMLELKTVCEDLTKIEKI